MSNDLDAFSKDKLLPPTAEKLGEEPGATGDSFAFFD
jgi:hypothetical protein